ncbi:MAG: signal recognition particle-docking protein FtsY [Oscillospiraceae bacterium]|nr:signal recognition particle-docking protein FtsY [Oscillospiraceae bacterium]
MGIFSKIRDGLKKTRDSVIKGLRKALGSFTKIDEELFEQLEETMIMGDMGAETAVQICDQLRSRVKERGITDPNDIMGLIQEITAEMMGEDEGLDLSTTPSVILVIGVNGAGKTTTIGKLCHQFKNGGKRVLVAAADTFRAAAIDQLAVWTERSGVELVRHAEGSDPAAVVFDAITAAKARGCDVVICDTAGRLHNKKNLMQELAKINRIIDREAEGCAKECLLVLDATTGQNAVSQARLFQEVAPITGIVLTKLDGTAKGGIVISIKHELGIPVKLIGVGEGIDDLQPFDSKSFIDALFDREPDEDSDAEKSSEADTAADAAAEPEETEPVTEEAVMPEPLPETAASFTEPEAAFAEPVQEFAEAIAEPVQTVTEQAEALPETAAVIAEETVQQAAGTTEETFRQIADTAEDAVQQTAETAEAAAEETVGEAPKKKGFFSFFRRKK